MPTSNRLLTAALLAVTLSIAPRLYAQTSATATTAPAAPAAPPPIVRHLAKGVDLIQETLYYGKPMGPHIITVFKVDPRIPGVHVEAGLGQDRVWGSDITLGREIVSKIVTRHKAVAGVNAGFFPFKGNPLGLHIQDGDLVTEPMPTRPASSFYLLKNGTSGFADFGYTGTAISPDGRTFAINGLNKQPAKTGNELLLFSPIFFPQTLAADGRYEVVLSGVPSPIQPNRTYTGKIASVGEGGKSKLAPGTVVLSGGGTGADFLRTAASSGVGASLSFRLDLPTTDGSAVKAEDIAFAVTGSPIILKNGQSMVHIRPRETGTFATIEHPRTAVGRTPEGVLLIVTVDGRQKGLSQGASLPELVKVLQDLGATDGINLDGGGSSDAVAWDAVANSPSDGSERSVADMLLVHADDLPTASAPPAKSSLTAPGHALQVGETFDFGAASGLSLNDNAVWGVTGTRRLIGFVSQTGVFHAIRPGEGNVTVTLGSRGRRLSVPITVQGKASEKAEFTPVLTLTPDPAASGTKSTLTVKIRNADGDPLVSEPVKIEVAGGRAEPGTSTTDRRGEIHVTLYWDAAAATRSVRVTSPQKRFRDSDPVAGPAASR